MNVKSIVSAIYMLTGTLAIVFGLLFGMSNTVKHDWFLLPLSLSLSAMGFKVLMCGLLGRGFIPKDVNERIIEKVRSLIRLALGKLAN